MRKAALPLLLWALPLAAAIQPTLIAERSAAPTASLAAIQLDVTPLYGLLQTSEGSFHPEQRASICISALIPVVLANQQGIAAPALLQLDLGAGTYGAWGLMHSSSYWLYRLAVLVASADACLSMPCGARWRNQVRQ